MAEFDSERLNRCCFWCWGSLLFLRYFIWLAFRHRFCISFRSSLIFPYSPASFCGIPAGTLETRRRREYL